MEEGLGPIPPRPLRTGYTTGACATAAAKGALLTLLDGAPPAQVSIWLPAGRTATFPLARVEGQGEAVLCGVVKDAGDDPDITHRALICAAVRRIPAPGVVLRGGPGVGRVTRPGLPVPVGEAAINPVPRRMLTATLSEILQARGLGGGVEVTLSIPGGEELARHTLNPRLGIVGGLSILGTTGIVKPYSTSAYRASIRLALDVAAAGGCDTVVLSTGSRSEGLARETLARYGLPEMAFVEMADFVGFALHQAARRGFRQLFVAGFVGKLAKVAAGEMDTHSGRSRLDTAFLAALARRAGGSDRLAARIGVAATAREALELARAAGLVGFPGEIARRAREACVAYLQSRGCRSVALTVLLYDFDGALLARAGETVGGPSAP